MDLHPVDLRTALHDGSPSTDYVQQLVVVELNVGYTRLFRFDINGSAASQMPHSVVHRPAGRGRTAGRRDELFHRDIDHDPGHRANSTPSSSPLRKGRSARPAPPPPAPSGREQGAAGRPPPARQRTTGITPNTSGMLWGDRVMLTPGSDPHTPPGRWPRPPGSCAGPASADTKPTGTNLEQAL